MARGGRRSARPGRWPGRRPEAGSVPSWSPPSAQGALQRSLRQLGVVVLVVPIPPLVRRALGVALGRVLPRLLASEGAQVEVAPGAAERLVAAVVDVVG